MKLKKIYVVGVPLLYKKKVQKYFCNENLWFINKHTFINLYIKKDIKIIYVWNDYKYAEELTQLFDNDVDIYILNILNSKKIIEPLIVFPITSKGFSDKIIKYIKLLREDKLYSNIISISNDILRLCDLLYNSHFHKKKYEKNKILILLDGDETDDQIKNIWAMAKYDNPDKEIVIKYLNKKVNYLSLDAHILQTDIWNFIFSIKKIYTLHSVCALFFMLFSPNIIIQGCEFSKFHGLSAAENTDYEYNELISVFYMQCCKYQKNDPVTGLISLIIGVNSLEFIKKEIYGYNIGKITQVLRYLKSKLKIFNKSINYYDYKVSIGYINKHMDFFVNKINELECPELLCLIDCIFNYGIQKKNIKNCYQLMYHVSMFKNQVVNSYRPKLIAECDFESELKKCSTLAKKRKFIESDRVGFSLIVSGYFCPEILWNLIMNSMHRFNFKQAAYICLIGENCFSYWKNGLFSFMAARYFFLCGNLENGFYQLCKNYLVIQYKPDIDLSQFRIGEKLKSCLGNFDWQKAFIYAKLKTYKKKNYEYSKCLFHAGYVDEALSISKKEKGLNPVIFTLKLYIYKGQFDIAKNMIENKIKKKIVGKLYQEYLSLGTYIGDYKLLLKILTEIRNHKININNYFELWLAYCAIGNIQKAFRLHGKSSYFQIMSNYMDNNLQLNLYSDMPRVETAMLLSECFIGDELRFSRIYPKIVEKINAEHCVISCDPRIYTLMTRSFPKLTFLPVKRLRELEMSNNYSDFMQLPGSDCTRYVDNEAWKVCKKSDRVITVMHALPSVVRVYEDLDDLPYLKVEEEKKQKITTNILNLLEDRNKKYVGGISWRSYFSDYNHEIYRINLEEMEALFSLKDILWINCQYDGATQAELDFFEKRFPNGLVTFHDIDQFNDIEMTAALYSCLDIMVSAPTYTADLSSAIGISTICPVKNKKFFSFCKFNTCFHAFADKYEFFYCKNENDFANFIRRVQELIIKESKYV